MQKAPETDHAGRCLFYICKSFICKCMNWIISIFRQWFAMNHRADEAPSKASSSDATIRVSSQLQSLHQMMDFLRQHYVLRYNRLTDRTECAKVGEDVFQPVDSRLLNSISLQVLQAGITCWDRDVKRYVESCEVSAYHPFAAFMERLPQWDGIDRVNPLAQRVSVDKLWVELFHRWMLATTAAYHPFAAFMERLPQWDGIDRVNPLAQRVSVDKLWVELFHRWMLATTAQWMEACGAVCPETAGKRANSVAPILVSTRQGLGKSTFCRMLLPQELQMYFTESLIVWLRF